MPDETTTETTQEQVQDTATATTTPVESAAQTKPQGKSYSEPEYKGLQAVIAKRDALIKELTEKNIQLEAEKAELESNHGKVSNEKANVDARYTETKAEADSLKKENAKLQKELDYQKIIMKDFSDIAEAAHLLPITETEEEFREKAKELRVTVNQLVKSNVKQVLGGASPPLEPGDTGNTLGVDELDEAYKNLVEEVKIIDMRV
jgi:chromosome segregation ATPase